MHLFHKRHLNICTGQVCAAQGRVSAEEVTLPQSSLHSRETDAVDGGKDHLRGPLAGVSLHGAGAHPFTPSLFLPLGAGVQLPTDPEGLCIRPAQHEVLGIWYMT